MHDKIFEDAFNMLCGDRIGEGIHRTVFKCKIRPDLVVKVEREETLRNFANVFEMKFWNDNQYRDSVAKWLAPCEFLSPDGRILLMKRVEPMTDAQFLTLGSIPSFLNDLKAENFGWLDGRPVSVDYVYTHVQVNPRVRKIKSLASK